jgi:hypothetical protein
VALSSTPGKRTRLSNVSSLAVTVLNHHDSTSILCGNRVNYYALLLLREHSHATTETQEQLQTPTTTRVLHTTTTTTTTTRVLHTTTTTMTKKRITMQILLRENCFFHTATTGWGRSVGFIIPQVIFRIRANLCGILIRKMTCEILNPMGLPHPILLLREHFWECLPSLPPMHSTRDFSYSAAYTARLILRCAGDAASLRPTCV